MSDTKKIIETVEQIASERGLSIRTSEVRYHCRAWVEIRVFDRRPVVAQNLGREIVRRTGARVTDSKRYEYRYTEFSTLPIGTIYTIHARPAGK